ncbi:peptidyl-prolyl cis-trans isomerase [bacterium]|nr:peptidyl-prolyl cis-trans isomerase [bacterium]
MKNLFNISLICLFASCAPQVEDDSVVLARVNNQTLTVKSLEKLLPPEDRTDSRLKNFIFDWVDNALYYDAAVNSGLLQDGALQAARDLYYKKILIGAYLQTRSTPKTSISNDEIRNYYDGHIDEFSRDADGALIHQFYTNKHSDARSIRSVLKKKKSQKSIDELFTKYKVETKTVSKGQMIQKFDSAIFKNKTLKVVGPIQTDVGYHVIKVVRRFKKGSPIGLEDAYDEIYQRLLKQKQLNMSAGILDSLKEKTNVFINSNYQ